MKASQTIDMLFKIASYLKPIRCEACGYEGKPEYNGLCPECGASCGVKPKEVYVKKDQPYDRSLSTSKLYDAVEASRYDSVFATL